MTNLPDLAGHGDDSAAGLLVDWPAVCEFLNLIGRTGTDGEQIVLAVYPPDPAKPCRHFVASTLIPEAIPWQEVEEQLRRHPTHSLGVVIQAPAPVPADWGSAPEHLNKAGFIKAWGASNHHIARFVGGISDLDGGLSIDAQLGLPAFAELPPPSLAVATGGKSVHFYWLLAPGQEWRDPESYRRLVRAIAAAIKAVRPEAGVDEGIHNPSRVMRLPGGLHPKTGRRSEVLFSNGPRYTVADLEALTDRIEQATGTTPPPPAPPRTRVAITGGADGRNPSASTWFDRCGRQEQLELAASMLQTIPPRGKPKSETYNDALRAAFALANHFGIDGALHVIDLAGWHSPHWNVEEKLADADGSSGIQCLIAMARERGWRHPKGDEIDAARTKKASRRTGAAAPAVAGAPGAAAVAVSSEPVPVTDTQESGQAICSWGELEAAAEQLAQQLAIATEEGGTGWRPLLPQLIALAEQWARASAVDPEVKAGRGALEQLLGDTGGMGRREANRILGAAAASYRQQKAEERRVAAEQHRQERAAEKAAKQAAREEAAARAAATAAEREERAKEALQGQPFLVKGWDPARKAIYYQHRATGQLGSLPAPNGSGSSGLLAVADIDWWEAAYPAGGERAGACWMAAASSFIEAANARPAFRPANIRGRGVWLDADRVVWNLGDRLLVDGQLVPLAELESSNTYALAMPLPPIERGPLLSDQQGGEILLAVQAVGWQEPMAGLMVCGWTACAIAGGALEHRPGLQLTGGSGKGKTTVLRRVVLPLLGGLAQLKANASEAAIRQGAKGDSLPVLIDESERGDNSGRLRAGHLHLLRHSYEGSSASRGTVHGEPLEQPILYSLLLSGINATITNQPDRNRVAMATRRHLPVEEWQQVERQLVATITPDVGGALVRRVVSNLRTLRANAQVMAAAIERLGDTGREGDCYGALLAGAHLFTSTEQLTVEAATAWLLAIGWEGVSAQSSDDPQQEARQCLEAILSHRIRWSGDAFPSAEVTVGELVAAVMEGAVGGKRALIAPDEAVRALGRIGVKVLVGKGAIGGSVAIANNSPGLMDVLERTPWAQGGHRQHLLALPGAQPVGRDQPLRFATDPTVRRAVAVPWEAIAGPREERLVAASVW